MSANFVKMDLLNHMKSINLIPKFQEGTTTQRDKKTIQSWKKQVPKFGILGHPGLFSNPIAKWLK